MFSTLRTRFGIPGVISVIALVFAMFGGAYAASNSGGGHATASAKAKKGPRGPKGATGPAGPAGTQGPAGLKGDAGAAGAPGTGGKSVTVSEIEAGEPGECEETGGALVKQEGASSGVEVCAGEEGPEGSPWTAGGTLPKGKTETGAWAFGQLSKAFAYVPISFPIPLKEEGLYEEGFGAGVIVPSCAEKVEPDKAACEAELPAKEEHCPGSVAEPLADEGYLCVYVTKLGGSHGEVFVKSPHFSGEIVGTTGAILNVELGEGSEGFGGGSWAVTAAK